MNARCKCVVSNWRNDVGNHDAQRSVDDGFSEKRHDLAGESQITLMRLII